LDPGPVPCHPVGIRIGFDREIDMKMAVRAVAAALGLALASSAMAQVALDLKLGYGVPMGTVWAASPWNPAWSMSNAWTGSVPIEVGARYRITPAISLGAYFGWGPAFVTSTGFAGIAGSSGSDMRLGIQLAYTFSADRPMSPWFSVGTGWEWTSFSGTSSGQDASVTMNGWEYLNLQTGLDFNVARAFAIGPYVGFLAGTYSSIVASGAANTGPGNNYGGAIDPAARSFHGWFQFGVKGTLNL
jgi:hypothetical protein